MGGRYFLNNSRASWTSVALGTIEDISSASPYTDAWVSPTERLAEAIKPHTYQIAICSAFKEPSQSGLGKQQVAIIAKEPAQAARISEQINGEAEAVILICPLVSEEMSGSEQALEAAVVDVENAVEVIRIATAVAFGKWRDDRKILLTKTKRLTVQPSKAIPATLDGESVNLGTRAQIDFVSEVLTVLVPGK